MNKKNKKSAKPAKTFNSLAQLPSGETLFNHLTKNHNLPNTKENRAICDLTYKFAIAKNPDNKNLSTLKDNYKEFLEIISDRLDQVKYYAENFFGGDVPNKIWGVCINPNILNESLTDDEGNRISNETIQISDLSSNIAQGLHQSSKEDQHYQQALFAFLLFAKDAFSNQIDEINELLKLNVQHDISPALEIIDTQILLFNLADIPETIENLKHTVIYDDIYALIDRHKNLENLAKKYEQKEINNTKPDQNKPKLRLVK